MEAGADGEIVRLRTRAQAHRDAVRDATSAARGGFVWRAAITGLLTFFAAALLVEWTVASVVTSIALLAAVVAVGPWVAGYDLERVRRAAERLDALPRAELELAASGASYRG